MLDVPTAEPLERGAGLLGLEMGLDGGGSAAAFSSARISLGAGIGAGLEVGASFREGGWPGDPRLPSALFAGNLKLKVRDAASGGWPSLAVSASVDQPNRNIFAGLRVIASTQVLERIRVTGFLGAEQEGLRLRTLTPTAGLAAGFAFQERLEGVAEGLAGGRGELVGAALRWDLTPVIGLSANVTWRPRENALSAGVGLGFASAPPKDTRPRPNEPPIEEQKPLGPPQPGTPVFADDRPRFRMRIKSLLPHSEGAGVHFQYGGPTARPVPGPGLDLPRTGNTGPKTRASKEEPHPAEAEPQPAKLEPAMSEPVEPRRAQTESPTPPAPPAVNLRVGMQGEDVLALQKVLIERDYFSERDLESGPGTFGPRTEQAVRSVQHDHGLPVSGFYGPLTRAALERSRESVAAPARELPAAGLRRGMRGREVLALQEALVRRLFMSTADLESGAGLFGPRTERAVRSFQRANFLPPTGFYGPLTREALRQSFESPERLHASGGER